MIEIKKNLNEEIENDTCIIDFWAPWCGPCKIFGPIFEEVSKEINDIKFCKINVDENQEICKDLGIMSIPTVILFKNSKEIRRSIGLMNKNELIKFIGEINV